MVLQKRLCQVFGSRVHKVEISEWTTSSGKYLQLLSGTSCLFLCFFSLPVFFFFLSLSLSLSPHGYLLASNFCRVVMDVYEVTWVAIFHKNPRSAQGDKYFFFSVNHWSRDILFWLRIFGLKDWKAVCFLFFILVAAADGNVRMQKVVPSGNLTEMR